MPAELRALLALLLTLAVVPAASAAPGVKQGEHLYGRYCVSCHGPEARGDGPLAKDLRVPVPDLTTLTTRSGGTYPFDRVVRIVTKGSEVRGHGTDDMPAWGSAFRRTEGTDTLVDEAIRNLTQYLWSVQRAK